MAGRKFGPSFIQWQSALNPIPAANFLAIPFRRFQHRLPDQSCIYDWQTLFAQTGPNCRSLGRNAGFNSDIHADRKSIRGRCR
jgi:hypothetical protein